jgi:hypothetical protein
MSRLASTPQAEASGPAAVWLSPRARYLACLMSLERGASRRVNLGRPASECLANGLELTHSSTTRASLVTLSQSLILSISSRTTSPPLPSHKMDPAQAGALCFLAFITGLIIASLTVDNDNALEHWAVGAFAPSHSRRDPRQHGHIQSADG